MPFMVYLTALFAFFTFICVCVCLPYDLRWTLSLNQRPEVSGGLASQPAPGIRLSPPSNSGVAFHVGARDSNSGPDVCRVNTLTL